MKRASKTRRAIRAALIVTLIVASVPMVSFARETAIRLPAFVESVEMLLSAEQDWDKGVPFLDREIDGSLDEVGAEQGKDAVSFAFMAECLDLSREQGVVSLRDGAVVGFSCEGLADEVFLRVADELQSKGWTLLESGAVGQATFAKDDGAYRWLFVSCVQVADMTSVVVHRS